MKLIEYQILYQLPLRMICRQAC